MIANNEEIEKHRAYAGGDTRRAVVPAMEDILYDTFDVLDHGFVRVIDYMGDDSAIVQAARVSYGAGTKSVSDDAGLINYLMRHRHTSPFEMCEIKLHIKLPIFIARQWIRHRTASVNEQSARYSVVPTEFFIPQQGDLTGPAENNRQGRSSEPIEDAHLVRRMLCSHCASSGDFYDQLINKEGLSRELSRMALPLNTYTEWYWKIDLHNLLHFCSLRDDSHAQKEIQDYAATIFEEVVMRWVPIAAEAFLEHRKEAVTFSRTAMTFIREYFENGGNAARPAGMGNREYREVLQLLGLKEPS